MRFSLDHVGMVGGAASGLPAQWQRLGFSLTESAELLGSAERAGSAALGQRSAHAVLEHGYIELSEVCSTDPAHHLANHLRRGGGLHILALGCDDIATAHRKYQSEGIACGTIAWASRDIAYGARHGSARFEWFQVLPDAAAAGLLCVVRNHTPELVYQPQVMTHANSANALRGIVLAYHDVASTARRYERLLDVAAQPVGEALCLVLEDGALVLRNAAACATDYGTPLDFVGERFAALQVAVANLAQTRQWLRSQAVPFCVRGATLVLQAAQSGGAGLEFLPP